MKKLLILSLVALCANLSFAQTKYVDRVLAESEVTVTKKILYASNYTVLLGGPPFTLEPLYMDVYTPNDGASNRPLVIYTHTGSFLPRYINQTPTGARDDSATVAICTDLARRGYVVASISYRLGWNPQGATESIRKNTIINAAYKGVQDLSAAIRFFKQSADKNGNPYGIDPS
ncbi:MAG: alpha/beta hydrolase, partial [Bacteroidia bacterium]